MARFSLSPSRIARYFYHDCERHLRFHATPSRRRSVEGVPARPYDQSPVTAAILEGGYHWEEQVIQTCLEGRARIATGDGPLRDRTHTAEATLDLLVELEPGQAVYQPTLLAPPVFLERYGLDPELVEFVACRPDLIQRIDGPDGRPRVRIIDVKASDFLKTSHRIQTALYTLILRDMVRAAGRGVDVDLHTAGIWLYDRPEPEWFDLSLTTGVLETFLRDRLEAILRPPAGEVPWHLFFRCEWCEYYDHCRKEAEETRSVSLLPYLSIGGRRYLHQAPWGGAPVDTLDDLGALLESDVAEWALNACGSLKGKRDRMRRALEALETGQVVAHGSSSVALPIREDILIAVTLQSDPHSGATYAAGFRRVKGVDVYGDGAREVIFVAGREADCATVKRAFLKAFYAELEVLHAYNLPREWKDRRSLQTYVFDGYEQDMLQELLLEALKDAELAPIALQILFHYQDETLANAEKQPGQEVAFPTVVLTRVIQQLAALPSPLALRLQDVSAALPSPGFNFRYTTTDLFSFELSNRLKSDAIFMAWHKEKPEAVDWVRNELHRRLVAVGAVVDGLRAQVGARLFAWPPKFLLPAAWDFQHAELSKLAFIARYECFMGALAVRELRTRPWLERVRDGVSLELTYAGGDWWAVATVDPSQLEQRRGHFDNLIVPAGEEGERAQMCYDDHYNRGRWFSPAKGVARVAAIRDVDVDPETRLVRRIKVEVAKLKADAPIEAGARYVLHPRFTDFNTDRIVKHLQSIDREPDLDFVRLIGDPRVFATSIVEAPEVLEAARAAGDGAGFTLSQQQAFEQLCTNRLTLVWGPPGTGKTHFLAKALLGLSAGWMKSDRPLRVGITAFTHAAIENLLAEVLEVSQAQGGGPDIFKVGGLSTPRGQELQQLSPEEAALRPKTAIVLGGTVYTMLKAAKAGVERFDVLLVDEASQMKLGELSLAMVMLREGGRLVLAGDDLQLPPIIQGAYPEPEDGLPGMQDSAFAWLRARDREAAPFTCQLVECWRMNATLSRFPAETLYGPGYRPATARIATRQLALLKAPAPEALNVVGEVDESAENRTVGSAGDVSAWDRDVDSAEDVSSLGRDVSDTYDGSAVHRDVGSAGDGSSWGRGISDADDGSAVHRDVGSGVDGVAEVGSLMEWLLDPAWPLAVCVLEDVQATAENRVEAELVARLAVALRQRLLRGDDWPYDADEDGDRDFWRAGLFIVSPHHVQKRAIHRELAARYPWRSRPFVDTVDKMQGQQCDAVIVSYGVSDPETATGEAEFIYSLNRLNVSVTRARCKTIVFLCRPLLEPPFDLLHNDRAAKGLAHMHALLGFCRRAPGEERRFRLDGLDVRDGGRLTALRGRWEDGTDSTPAVNPLA